MKQWNDLLGVEGFSEFANTAAHAGAWGAIQIVADAKFHTLTGNISGFGANATSGSATTYFAGDIIFGKFSALQLHSGRVRAYNRA